ncbi:MAG: metallophosphoesterase [Tannerella sp.]|jgi:predicted MPP superfamily phosphohydrolase|nr:metallophosphoesterase [Tannerella sp.]
MRVFLHSIFGQILFSAYIMWRGGQALPPGKRYRLPFYIILTLEVVIFLTGYIFHNYLPDSVFIPLLYICGTWYIASLYITLVLLAFELFRWINKGWAWYPMFVNLYWEKTKIALFVLVTIGIAMLMIHGYKNTKYPDVQEVYVTIPKHVEGHDSLTIVLASDWHIGEMIGKQQVQHNVKLINDQHPDMILIGGDILDYELRLAEKQHIEADLLQLRAPLGVFAVLGNHEYRANHLAKLKWIEKAGMKLLVDSVYSPPDSSFYLIGRDDYTNHKNRATLTSLMQKVDISKPVILLDHQPNHLTEIAMNHVDLSLHGHTHNGQVWPSPLLLHLVFECPYGYYRKGDTQFFVSSGVGFAGPPYRIGTSSEIVVLHVHFGMPEEK